MSLAGFQVAGVEFALEVGHSQVGNFVHSLIHPFNKPIFTEWPEPLRNVVPAVSTVVCDNFRGKHQFALCKRFENAVIGLRHPRHIRAPVHRPYTMDHGFNPPDDLRILLERFGSTLLLGRYNTQNCELELSSWALDIRSNDYPGQGATWHEWNQAPRGLGGRCQSPTMNPNNDRVSLYDGDEVKSTDHRTAGHCPRCGTRILAITTTGPQEHHVAPCGHAFAAPVAEVARA